MSSAKKGRSRFGFNKRAQPSRDREVLAKKLEKVDTEEGIEAFPGIQLRNQSDADFSFLFEADVMMKDLPLEEVREGTSDRVCRARLREQLVSMESDYVSDLSMILTTVRPPLVKGPKEARVLSRAEDRVVFGAISGIHKLHTNLVQFLQDGLPVALAFTKMMTHFQRAYQPYYTRYSTASEVMSHKRSPNTPTLKVIRSLERTLAASGHDNSLDEVLLLPMQQLSKYPLFLSELLKYTPRESPAWIQLSDVLRRVRGVIEHVTHWRDQPLDRQRLIALHERFVPSPALSRLNLLHSPSGRYMLRECDVTVWMPSTAAVSGAPSGRDGSLRQRTKQGKKVKRSKRGGRSHGASQVGTVSLHDGHTCALPALSPHCTWKGNVLRLVEARLILLTDCLLICQRLRRHSRSGASDDADGMHDETDGDDDGDGGACSAAKGNADATEARLGNDTCLRLVTAIELDRIVLSDQACNGAGDAESAAHMEEDGSTHSTATLHCIGMQASASDASGSTASVGKGAVGGGTSMSTSGKSTSKVLAAMRAQAQAERKKWDEVKRVSVCVTFKRTRDCRAWMKKLAEAVSTFVSRDAAETTFLVREQPVVRGRSAGPPHFGLWSVSSTALSRLDPIRRSVTGYYTLKQVKDFRKGYVRRERSILLRTDHGTLVLHTWDTVAFYDALLAVKDPQAFQARKKRQAYRGKDVQGRASTATASQALALKQSASATQASSSSFESTGAVDSAAAAASRRGHSNAAATIRITRMRHGDKAAKRRGGCSRHRDASNAVPRPRNASHKAPGDDDGANSSGSTVVVGDDASLVDFDGGAAIATPLRVKRLQAVVTEQAETIEHLRARLATVEQENAHLHKLLASHGAEKPRSRDDEDSDGDTEPEQGARGGGSQAPGIAPLAYDYVSEEEEGDETDPLYDPDDFIGTVEAALVPLSLTKDALQQRIHELLTSESDDDAYVHLPYPFDDDGESTDFTE